jgi:hypothetical protein
MQSDSCLIAGQARNGQHLKSHGTGDLSLSPPRGVNTGEDGAVPDCATHPREPLVVAQPPFAPNEPTLANGTCDSQVETAPDKARSVYVASTQNPHR